VISNAVFPALTAQIHGMDAIWLFSEMNQKFRGADKTASGNRYELGKAGL
jgi:hypothetical protein